MKAPNNWEREDYYLDSIGDEWMLNLIEIQHELSQATHCFFDSIGFKTMYLPVTTGSISSPMGLGSDSLPVKIKLHGIETYLADSMQFLLEYGCRLSNSGTYYLMPSFRGEQSDNRHLCQFYHSECEIIGTLEDVMRIAEDYIRFITKHIVEKLGDKLVERVGTIQHLLDLVNDETEFLKLTFDEVEEFLMKFEDSNLLIKNENSIRFITSLGEQRLLQIKGPKPIWITHYDYLSVPFYQAFTDDRKYAKNADLIFGIGETIGSGERHVSIRQIEESLKLHQVNPAEYDWYIKMKEKFPLNTSGFGMGTERFILWILKHNDIRDCQILIRENGKALNP